jgi:hypothetical protein
MRKAVDVVCGTSTSVAFHSHGQVLSTCTMPRHGLFPPGNQHHRALEYGDYGPRTTLGVLAPATALACSHCKERRFMGRTIGRAFDLKPRFSKLHSTGLGTSAELHARWRMAAQLDACLLLYRYPTLCASLLFCILSSRTNTCSRSRCPVVFCIGYRVDGLGNGQGPDKGTRPGRGD